MIDILISILKWGLFSIIFFIIIQDVRDYLLTVKFLSVFIATRIFYREYHKEILHKEVWEPRRKIYLCWNGKYLVIVFLSSNIKKADETFLMLINKTENAYQKFDYELKCIYKKEYKKILLLKRVIES